MYAFFMSIISGYPVGSRICYDLYNNNLISKGEASRISLLSSTSGPLFVIGAVGINMFNNKMYGVVIYISHVLSAIFTALIFRNYGDKPQPLSYTTKKTTTNNILYDCMYSSVTSSIIVGGFISIFYVISQIFYDFKLLSPLTAIFSFVLSPFNLPKSTASALSIGIIECTSGCLQLSSISNSVVNCALSSALISFGGISIIMQSLAYLTKIGVKPLFFITGKLIQTTLSFLISLVVFLVFI